MSSGDAFMSSEDSKESYDEYQTPPDWEPTLRIIALPEHANRNGDMFGGWILSQMDIAASIPAIERCKGIVSTVAVDSMVFKKPAYVGDEITLYTHIEKVGRSSMAIRVLAWVRRPVSGRRYQVTEGLFTFVALDEHRRPRPVDDIRYHLTEEQFERIRRRA
jgi:acyl-CoA thioesterase YciA